ncbi:MAG: acyl CoA:acetate/3-ketoacid CoA transferase [Candidatus Dormibacteraeota bacterium]|nr:acyl CoA:acetate/3-ketoacid CoA transferase [Candidatus Dormibacteraeota bacterium]
MRLASVQEAVASIPDGATVAVDGFTLMGVAEALYEGIEDAFRQTGHPRDLVIVHAAGQSNRKIGFEHFAVEGLAKRIVGPHWGLMPRMSEFLGQGLAEAVCLPQGQISTLYRAIAAGRPGNLTRIGLGTFVDPRIEGGKVNQPARDHAPDYVAIERIDEQDFLFYRSFKIDVGIFRASAVDPGGNCSLDEEAVMLDALAIAQAAHNAGGLVICQAKKLVGRGTIAPRHVAVPGALVDLVVQAPDPERQHRQTDGVFFDERYISSSSGDELPRAEFSTRLAIGRRAIRYLHQGDIVNIGTGIPGDSVGPALAEAGLSDAITLTVESGVYGGVPAGGVDFGITRHPTAIIPHASQFDFYNGGGLDATFMGAGQVDREGNVNVSRLGGRVIGAGGFIDITQSARLVCFCFTLEGKREKFVNLVDHLTFSAEQARRNNQEVLYVTERAVFRLEPDGLALIEIAPGLEIKNVLDQIPFTVRIHEPVARMPEDIFQPIVAPFALPTRPAGKMRPQGAVSSGG